MTKSYNELNSLVKDQKDLSDFFSKSHDYKKVFLKALKEENHVAIKALAENLPVKSWFDKDETYESFVRVLSTTVFNAGDYIWCMSNPEIRACFSPEEKGKFVHAGMILKKHPLAYYGTLDGWKGKNVFEDILEIELVRLTGHNVRWLDSKHLQKSYFEWVEKEFFPYVTQERQFQFLLGSLMLMVGQVRCLSDSQSLLEMGLMEDKEISQTSKDLKECVEHLKDVLQFKYWTDDFKKEFLKYMTSPVPLAVSQNIYPDEIMEFAERIKPIVEYKKLNNSLPEKPENPSERKNKI